MERSEHNLCVRTYPDEYTKVMEHNFGVVYDSGYDIEITYPSRNHPENLCDIFGIRFGVNSHL